MANKTIDVEEAASKLSSLLEGFEKGSEPIVLEKDGEPLATILPTCDYEGLLETLDILKNSDEVMGILEGMKELQEGKGIPFDEVFPEFADDNRKAG